MLTALGTDSFLICNDCKSAGALYTITRTVWTIQDESIDQPTMLGHVDEEGER